MAPQMNDEPRYGQRSPEEPQGAAQGVPPQAQTPWPQYGQVPPQQGPAYGAHQGAVPAQAGANPEAPSPGQGGQAQGPAYGQQAPYAAPGPQAPYGAAPQYGYLPNGAPAPKLPGRGGPIALIIIGILTSLIIAPLAFLGGILGGMDIGSMVDNVKPVSSGSTVSVDQSGALMISTQSGELTSCSLEGAGGTHQMELVSRNTFFAENISQGDYVVECVGSGSSNLMVISGLNTDALTNAGVSGLAWGTGIGILGLLLAIGGIVWLVIVNRRRRGIQATARGY